MCLGARVASNEMYSLICRLLQDYRLELTPNHPEVGYLPRFFYVPETSPQIQFIPRK